MSRKIKQGLDYFPHNCQYNDKLKYIIALHKSKGYYIYFEILKKIYSEKGYYMKGNKKVLILFSNEINIEIEEVNKVINSCISENIFNKKLFDTYNILTSKGIQERYFEAIKRRKEIELINVYILLDNVNILLNNVNINYLNVNKSTQSKVKYSKVNKSKVKYSIVKKNNSTNNLGKYFALAKKLSKIIQQNKNISHPKNQIISWSREIKKLNTQNKIEPSRINQALIWYKKHVGEEFVPVIESGISLRNKFTKLENAIDRDNNKNKPKKQKEFSNSFTKRMEDEYEDPKDGYV